MYQMPVRAIKNILRKELEDFKGHALQSLRTCNTMSDVPKEMIYIAYTNLLEVLEKSNEYSSLEDYISYAGYRMSLQEWIESL
jgi:hypothetical protein